MKARRRRRSGSLADLKRALWAAICYNRDVLEDDTHAHELRQKASNALVQAGLAYVKITEVTDILPQLAALERAAERNGT
jgi:hypothetical protein